MSFTGKATYDAGPSLPELVDDVSDVIGIVSPHETPLLDHLGDAQRPALSTVHEWIEDALLPNADVINQMTFSPDPQSETTITVANGSRFREGDLVRPDGSGEVIFVASVKGPDLQVIRAYGGTVPATLVDGLTLHILGNAALEGADATDARFTTRARQQNYAQIFSATVEVSGSMQAARAHGVDDEFDYQMQERMRELLRDLENCVINGVAPIGAQQGSSAVRRSMNGIVNSVQSNMLLPGMDDIPPGDGAQENELNESVLNGSLRHVWERSSGTVDTIVVNGFQKRRINEFVSSSRAYAPEDTRFRSLVSIYESDFGVARVILSRWVPSDTILLLDSTRINVLPLVGRSFGFKQLATTGDALSGQLVGEYTLEFRNEAAHGLLTGLATA